MIPSQSEDRLLEALKLVGEGERNGLIRLEEDIRYLTIIEEANFSNIHLNEKWLVIKENIGYNKSKLIKEWFMERKEFLRKNPPGEIKIVLKDVK